MIKRYIMCILFGLIFSAAFTQNQQTSASDKLPANFHQRWEVDGGGSYIIPTGNKQWTEFNWKGEVRFRFVLIEEKPEYTMLYDASRNMYVKLTDTQLFWGNNLDGVVYRDAHGSWIEEAAKKKQ